MYIMDLYGKKITVTDLDKAVAQAEWFSGLAHEEPNPAQVIADGERKTYWTDIYQKLLQLQSD